MEISFKFIGLNFEAEVYLDSSYDDEPGVVFESLTCQGKDASFLADSTLEIALEEAAWEGVEAARRKEADEYVSDQYFLQRLEESA